MEAKKSIFQVKNYVNILLWPLENHYYHQYSHALEVMDRSLYIWEKEWLSEDDLEILAIASLFHDTWFIIQYDDNELIWAWIARNYLKSILFPEEKIQKIEELIIATIPKREPKNLLERIIKDADMDNLWRDDFFDKWKRLRKELEEIKNIKILEPDWNHYSIDLLRQHRFLTKTEINEREQKKQENLKKLENWNEA